MNMYTVHVSWEVCVSYNFENHVENLGHNPCPQIQIRGIQDKIGSLSLTPLGKNYFVKQARESLRTQELKVAIKARFFIIFFSCVKMTPVII